MAKFISSSPLQACMELLEWNRLPVSPDELQQTNKAECGLCVIHRLGQKTFGFDNTALSVQILRQNLLVLILSVASVYQASLFQFRSNSALVNSEIEVRAGPYFIYSKHSRRLSVAQPFRSISGRCLRYFREQCHHHQ